MAELADPDERTDLDPSIRGAARLVASGDAEAALDMLGPLMTRDDTSLAPRFVLALAAWRMKRLDWSIEILRQCHEQFPMDADVAEMLASLYAQSGNFVDSLYMGKLSTALGVAGDLAKLVPANFPGFARAIVGIQDKPLLARAKVSLEAGRLDDAIDKAQQHVALDRGGSDGVSFLAAALIRAARPGGAVDAIAGIEDQVQTMPALAGLYAHALASVGDDDAARKWYREALDLAPDDATIAAVEIADGVWLEPDAGHVAGADWVSRFCRPAAPRRWRKPGDRLVIAYLVSALADPRDAAAVAATARAHDRGRVKVVAFGRGAQSWPENSALSGAFDGWRDIASLDDATLARMLDREGAHIVIDACGLAAPASVMALARLDSAIRVSWLGNHAAIGAPVYDAVITAAAAERQGGWPIGGGYAVCPPLRPAARIERTAPTFGADIQLPQLDQATVKTWCDILHAAPTAKLLLRAAETGSGTVDRLIARFGRELAARIDLITTERFEEFWAHVDVALAPWRGVSPRLAAEAIACGVPPVAFAGTSPAEPYGAFLRGVGLGGALVAGDARDYVTIALGLAGSAHERGRVIAAFRAGDHGPDGFARAVEIHAARLLDARATK